MPPHFLNIRASSFPRLFSNAGESVALEPRSDKMVTSTADIFGCGCSKALVVGRMAMPGGLFLALSKISTAFCVNLLETCSRIFPEKALVVINDLSTKIDAYFSS